MLNFNCSLDSINKYDKEGEMKIIVLGAGGFIGKNLVLKLLKQNYQVVAIDKYKINIDHPLLLKVTDAINEDFALENYIEEGDCLIYLLANSMPIHSNQDIYNDAKNNVMLAIKLFDKSIQAKIKKIIFASSGGTVYGPYQHLPLDEKHPTNPNSAYGIAKLTTEKYLDLMCNNAKITGISLRIANPFGPGQLPFRGQGVIATYLASFLCEKHIEIWGDGQAIRDYLYIDDVVDAFIKAIEYHGASDVFNIGSNEGHNLTEIVDILSEITHVYPHIEYKATSGVEVNANILDNTKAKTMLSWYPRYNFKDGIRAMYDTWDEESTSFKIDTNIK